MLVVAGAGSAYVSWAWAGYAALMASYSHKPGRRNDIEHFKVFARSAENQGLPYGKVMALVASNARGTGNVYHPTIEEIGRETKSIVSMGASSVALDPEHGKVTLLLRDGSVQFAKKLPGSAPFTGWDISLRAFDRRSTRTALSPDGRFAAVVENNADISLWNTRSGTRLWREKALSAREAKANDVHITFSLTGEHVLASGSGVSVVRAVKGSPSMCSISHSLFQSRLQFLDPYHVSASQWMRGCTSEHQCNGLEGVDVRTCEWSSYSSLLGRFRRSRRPQFLTSANYDHVSGEDREEGPGGRPTRQRHGSIVEVATTDGSGIAMVKNPNGTYSLINLFSGRRLGKGYEMSAEPTSLHLLPGHNLLVVGDAQGWITLWDALWYTPLARFGSIGDANAPIEIKAGNHERVLAVTGCPRQCFIHLARLSDPPSSVIAPVIQVLRWVAHLRHRFDALIGIFKEYPVEAALEPQQLPPAPTDRSSRTAERLESIQRLIDAAKAEPWYRPTNGAITQEFSEATKGVDIVGARDQLVLAVADGKVVYAGSEMRGYGNLILIKHEHSVMSAYAHNERLDVKVDDVVSAGDVIARMGSSDADQVKLHFEIRVAGKPIDPRILIDFSTPKVPARPQGEQADPSPPASPGTSRSRPP